MTQPTDSAPRFDPDGNALVSSITPRAHWNDLVLPPAESALMQQIGVEITKFAPVREERAGIVAREHADRRAVSAARRSAGKHAGIAAHENAVEPVGIAALFSGGSGTGKSMAAEVLAMESKRSLLRIDLAAVVSKYIGETEKALDALFERAENSGAILILDEADALFGKRTETKDAHDRYANIEINHLLQRIEEYNGLTILTTRRKSAIDAAFLRRLRFIVDFPARDETG